MNDRRVRSWAFADCIFDEANWSLSVAGRRVSVESKPLELLRELLLHAGNLVSKAELLDAIWPDISVVEASLPTAIHKLRHALCDDHRDPPIIETIPRLGYRLAVPVEVVESTDAPSPLFIRVSPPAVAARSIPPTEGLAARVGRNRLLVAGCGLATAALVATVPLVSAQNSAATQGPRVYSNAEAVIALRRLDIAKIDSMIAAGWKPDAPIDGDRNNALNRLLEMCEWQPAHDRARMLIVARTLIDGGVTLNVRNVHGDTAYSIAKAERYCGPDHPVTVMIHNMCYAKGKAAGEKCLATYELERAGPADPNRRGPSSQVSR